MTTQISPPRHYPFFSPSSPFSLPPKLLSHATRNCNLKQDSLSFLLELLSQPTAPFREGHVIQCIQRRLLGSGVPYFTDPCGNLVLGASSPSEYLRLIRAQEDLILAALNSRPLTAPARSKRVEQTSSGGPAKSPVRIFIAHMDHPGFHGVKWIGISKKRAELLVRWHGGAPTQHLKGAPVWIADRTGNIAEGTLQKIQLTASRRSIETAHVLMEIGPQGKKADKRKNNSYLGVASGAGLECGEFRAEDLFGGFRFQKPVWSEGKLLYTRAADDLIGVFTLVELARDLFSFRRKSRTRSRRADISRDVPFLGLLTRAEEVGFIGTIGHLSLGWLALARRSVMAVSLETSRTLAGAEIGKGPIVRLGDRYTVFDPNGLRVLTDLAEKVLPQAHQKRIMDAGSCEATAATAFGIPSIGLSMPLGNYHNQSFQGGPDSRGEGGPAPEFVHWDDLQGLTQLCRAIMDPKVSWDEPWNNTLKNFKKSAQQYASLIKTRP